MPFPTLLVGRQEWWGTGVVICLQQGADLVSFPFSFSLTKIAPRPDLVGRWLATLGAPGGRCKPLSRVLRHVTLGGRRRELGGTASLGGPSVSDFSRCPGHLRAKIVTGPFVVCSWRDRPPTHRPAPARCRQ